MRQMEDPPPVPERSRRRPPRSRAAEPVPLPGPTRGRRTKTVKLRDIMKAYQQAMIDAVETRLAAASEAAARAARQAVAEAMADRPRGPDGEDVARGLVAYADERFQALSVRLQGIEDALRGTSAPAPPVDGGPDNQVADRLRSLTDAVTALSEGHRALADEISRKTGHGVVGVARVIRNDLENVGRDVADLGKRIDALETSVRSLHRTLAWEGMRTPRPGGSPGAPSSG
ncbi:MAG TPA: hypothetical protein VHH92_00265 [Actinomycetota bacterium]|nr:hypothetical protein [Actinomycetota bacterium]